MYYETSNGYIAKVGASDNELKHWKYVSKKRGKDGRWIYVYDDSKVKAASKKAGKAYYEYEKAQAAKDRVWEDLAIGRDEDGEPTTIAYSTTKDRQRVSGTKSLVEERKREYEEAESEYKKKRRSANLEKNIAKGLNFINRLIYGK